MIYFSNMYILLKIQLFFRSFPYNLSDMQSLKSIDQNEKKKRLETPEVTERPPTVWNTLHFLNFYFEY